MARIFLLFKNPMFRSGIECLLERNPGLEIVGREEDPERAIKLIVELRPDIIVIDNGDSEKEQAMIIQRLVKLGLRIKVIGMNLDENSMTIYRGEKRIVKEVEDFVEAIQENPCAQIDISKEDWAALAQSRSRIYGFLAAVYNRLPDEQFTRNLQDPETAEFFSMLKQVEDLPKDVFDGITLVERYIRAQIGRTIEDVRTDLAVERTRLLRGVKPGYSPPPPYESVYRSADHHGTIQFGVEVSGIYADAGVELPEEVRDQPDFIGLEMDYMRHLAGMEAAAWSASNAVEALSFLNKERAFLGEHILCWIPQFCDVMFREARLDFYRGIATMTRGFVLDDAEKVAELNVWARAVEEE